MKRFWISGLQKGWLGVLAVGCIFLLVHVERGMRLGYATGQGHVILLAGLAWCVWQGRQNKGPPDFAKSLALGALGLGLAVGSHLTGKYTLMAYGLMPLLAAGILGLWGTRGVKAALPGIILVGLSIPISIAAATRWLRPITLSERQLVAMISAWMLRLSGILAWQHDVTVSMVGKQGAFDLKVEMMCSGYGYVASLFAVALPFLMHIKDSARRWRTLAMIPFVSVAANTLRVLLNAFVVAWLGNKAGFKFSHEWSGYAMLMASLVMLMFFDQLLEGLRILWCHNKGGIS